MPTFPHDSMSGRISPAGFDLDMTDRLLATTRAVRRRLDLAREVSDETIFSFGCPVPISRPRAATNPEPTSA